MTKTKTEIWQKEKGQKEKRTHHLSVRKENIAHDIRITGHGTLSSKAIRAISIDHPREVWRINGLTSSRFRLLQFPTFEVIKKNNKIKLKGRRRRKRLSIYLNSKGRHKASNVELLTVQPLKKLLRIGNAAPPLVVFSISHEVWGNHELRKVYQNLLFIFTHQLASHSLHMV